jgi:hypothetical protein
MRQFFLFPLFLLAVTCAQAQSANKAQPEPLAEQPKSEMTLAQVVPLTPAQEAKRARQARRQQGPEVYKGTLALQRRAIIDAPNAEDDQEPEDETATEEKAKPSRHGHGGSASSHLK